LLFVSLELSGTVRVWSLPEDMDEDIVASGSEFSQEQPKIVSAAQEFLVEDATGTFLQICPVKILGVGDVQVALACLDGSIAIVATGIVTPKCTKDPSVAGTILERWSTRDTSSSIALSGDWHPTEKRCLVVGRQDGLVEITGSKHHRIMHHESPVRAVSFSPDGQLLISASDEGMLCVWDVSRKAPVLVHHVVQAHDSWILSLTVLQDSRRFVSCGADKKLHVWNIGQMHQPHHSFSCDDTVWTTAASSQEQLQPRLVSGSEQGGLQIYSLEA
jgi:WD40 repeat protein